MRMPRLRQLLPKCGKTMQSIRCPGPRYFIDNPKSGGFSWCLPCLTAAYPSFQDIRTTQIISNHVVRYCKSIPLYPMNIVILNDIYIYIIIYIYIPSASRTHKFVVFFPQKPSFFFSYEKKTVFLRTYFLRTHWEKMILHCQSPTNSRRKINRHFQFLIISDDNFRVCTPKMPKTNI